MKSEFLFAAPAVAFIVGCLSLAMLFVYGASMT